MARNQTPGSVRIRTDEGNEWRYDAIQKAANFYDCNRSNAVAFACEDVTNSFTQLAASSSARASPGSNVARSPRPFRLEPSPSTSRRRSP